MWHSRMQKPAWTLPSHLSFQEPAVGQQLVTQKPPVNMPKSGNCTSVINLRYQDGSEGSPSNPSKFNNQDYEQLKDYSFRRGKLFVDSTFPPDNQSLGDLPDITNWREEQVQWLRPAEILKAQNNTDEPSFIQKGASRFDYGQGSVGNCWFLAAISSLTFRKSLMVQVVPIDQSFENYAGIFHFRFWRFGEWVDVVIDDLLPTLDNHLLSVHAKGGNEFWVPLLEKAYAKVCGSYADMNAGLPSEACKDFSGGVHMFYQLREVHSAGHDEKLWLSLSRATDCNSMICCGTAQKGETLVNTVAHNGLVDAHAYSVTAVYEVEYYGSKVKLVRVMNPWGRKEWNGDWSDKSDSWKGVSQEDLEKCYDRNEGEFWMKLEDFCHNFESLFICCENPNFIDGDLSCQWKCMIYDGSWVAGRSAGGNWSYSSFETNPQYRIQVTKIVDEEKEDKNILLSLMQKPMQQHRKQIKSYPIGLTVYQVPAGTPRGRLRSSFFNTNRPLKQIQTYTRERDLIEYHSLQPGEYVIIPSTMKPNMSADFVLTVYTKAEAKISPNNGDADGDSDSDDHDHEEENFVIPEIPTDSDDDKEDTNDRDSTLALFNRYANQSGELSARQLRRLLSDNFPRGTGSSFGLDTCRSLLAMMDTDHTMRMSFTEFSTLWDKINEYKKFFERSDLNETGSLSDYELRKAIEAAGMDTDDFFVRLMVHRYSGFSSTSLEAFIILMIRLEKMSGIFRDKSSDGMLNLTWREWTELSMYN